MKRILCFFLILTVITIPAFGQSQHNFESNIAVLYNTYTSNIIEEVIVENFEMTNNEINFDFIGRDYISINAPFESKKTIDGQQVINYIYEEGEKNIIVSVTNGYVTGKYQIKELSPAARLNNNYEEFGFLFQVDDSLKRIAASSSIGKENEISFSLVVDEITNSAMIKKQADKNISEFENYEKTVQEISKVKLFNENMDITTRSSTKEIDAYARSGAVVAEGTAYYVYIGANQYSVNKVTYICTDGASPLDQGYLSIWYDAYDTNAKWINKYKNRTSTENINVMVSSTGSSAFIAQTSKMGFVKIFGVPVPWFIDDYDINNFY